MTTEPVDRTGWPPGPWDLEDDRYEWRDEATGYPCIAKRNRMGALCGYVGIAPGHPWHGVDYSDIDASIHGGLTYSAPCDLEAGICHVATAGESDDLWWLGFDCAHMTDVVPHLLAIPETAHLFEEKDYGSDLGPFKITYKDIAYVRSECAILALQVKQVAS